MTTLDLDGQKHDFQREILAQQCQEQQSSPHGEPITELCSVVYRLHVNIRAKRGSAAHERSQCDTLLHDMVIGCYWMLLVRSYGSTSIILDPVFSRNSAFLFQ